MYLSIERLMNVIQGGGRAFKGKKHASRATLRKPLFVFVVAVLIQGCSYYRLTKEDLAQGDIPGDAPVRITRKDGSVIESGGFRHLLIRDRSDLVTGWGTERKTGKQFGGVLLRSEIDSSRLVVLKAADGTPSVYLVCWLKDNRSIGFAEYDHLDVTPDDAPGLWCAGTVAHQERVQPFKGRVDSSEIAFVETEGLALLHPFSARSSGQWLDCGFGGGRGSAALLLGGSVLVGNMYYGARMIGDVPLPVVEYKQLVTWFEVGGLLGVGFRSRYLSANASAGISYINGTDRRGPYVAFSGLAFPLDAELGVRPFESFGLALRLFSTTNSKVTWRGSFLVLQFSI